MSEFDTSCSVNLTDRGENLAAFEPANVDFVQNARILEA